MYTLLPFNFNLFFPNYHDNLPQSIKRALMFEVKDQRRKEKMIVIGRWIVEDECVMVCLSREDALCQSK